MPAVSGIYGIFNAVSGKIYVGQSSNMAARKQSHFWALRKGTHFNNMLQNSFSEHGEKCFEFRVLEEVPVDMLDVRERSWISYYRAASPGKLCNSESGGHLRKKLSPETRAKLSAAKLGSKLSPETIAKRTASRSGWRPTAEHVSRVAEALRGRPRPAHVVAAIIKAHTGLRPSEETLRKMSESHKGIAPSAATIAKIVAKTRGQKRSPETLARMREAQQRPEVRELKAKAMRETLAEKKRLKESASAPGSISQ